MGRKKKEVLAPVELLEKGINEGDWHSVCMGFKGLTGKTLKEPGENNKSPNDTLFQIFKLAQSYLELNESIDEFIENEDIDDKVTSTEEDDSESDDLVEQVIEDLEPIVAGPKGGMKSGQVNAKEHTIVFPTDCLKDKALEKVSKLAAKNSQKQRRMKYIPKMVKCPQGHEFDLNKNPSSIMLIGAGDSRQIRCPSCRERFPI